MNKVRLLVHTTDGKVLAIDSESTFISNDGGNSWSEPRPLTGTDDRNIKVSKERAMIRTKDGTMIAAFMNLNERHWTWNNDLHVRSGNGLRTSGWEPHWSSS